MPCVHSFITNGMQERLSDIYKRYNTVFKPLVAEQEARMCAIQDNLAMCMSMMFDYYYLYVNDSSNTYFIDNMVDTLNCGISMCYFNIATFMEENVVERFEKENDKHVRRSLNDGEFIVKYEDVLIEIKRCKESLNPAVAEINKTLKKNRGIIDYQIIKNFADNQIKFEEYYKRLIEIESLINSVSDVQTLVHANGNYKLKTIFGWVSSIVVAVIVGKIFHHFC